MHSLSSAVPELYPLLKSVSPYLDQYGYWAVFLGILLEDFGVPAPGEVLLIAASLLAAMGQFHIGWILLLGFAGAVCGDNIGYAIGYFGGRKVVLAYGRRVFLDEQRLRKLENFFARHGGVVVAGARFVQGFRQFNGIVAGLSRMRWLTFFLYNLLGAALWTGFWSAAAYWGGAGLVRLFPRFKWIELTLAGALLLTLAAWGVVHRLRRRRMRKKESR